MSEGEEEVNYTSVVFKAGNNPPPAAKRGEETVYSELKVQNETKNKDSAGHRRFQHLSCCLGILCVILLGGIIGVCVYQNANLTRDIQNLEDQLCNLTEAYNVSESNNKNLSAGVKELETQNQELKTRNQELETEKNNLTQKIHNMTTNWNELSISRAQWSIDEYCKQPGIDKCKACQKGWLLTEPSCYAYNNAETANRKTWKEARKDCKGKNSDLAVAHNPDEKEAISTNSFGFNGFWIGLRVVNKKWKWVDGSDLTDSSWIAAPVDGLCAVLYKGRDIWSSVSCDKPQQWICQQKALSLSV
ncbi:hypothetical protein JOQ06_026251 [Pogonophryne albipinna]|uniref:C-type lectin domain-containing protein n=1 Tax=Pogonophryne albipinna TaxID=1090488 RepID=A0AAD6A6W4_9TELE|nr:hypothetical protein JOQ06_026251 [Pogonophryne albipinna]